METHFISELFPEEVPSKTTITWQDSLTISHLSKDFPTLLALYQEYRQLEIILKDIEQIDLAAIQMLMSLQRSGLAHQKQVNITGQLNGEVSQLIQNAGLAEEVSQLGLKLDLNQ